MNVTVTNADHDNQHFDDAAIAFQEDDVLLILGDGGFVLHSFERDQWVAVTVTNEQETPT